MWQEDHHIYGIRMGMGEMIRMAITGLLMVMIW